MLQCILVDDNKMARMALSQIISQVHDLELVQQCETAMEAYNTLQIKPIDLIFLDIEMPGISGLELAKQIKEKKSLIIFTTGKQEYAIDAFDLNVVDYLIKPIALNRFLQAVDKAKELIQKNAHHQAIVLEFFFVKDKGGLKKININDILYFEAMGDYVKIHTVEKFYTVHSTLKAVEQKLSSELFLRVHRSYIIAFQKIERIEDGNICILKHKIPLADAYRSVLNQKITLL